MKASRVSAGFLGSGLINQSQKMTVAAMQDGGHEGVCASIIAGVESPPVLEATEHDFDLVALTVERAIVRDRHLAIGL